MTEIAERRKRYRYTECGLDNVFIEGIEAGVDDDGDEVLYIPAVNALHKTIARGIVESESGVTGQELRFLRTMMGLTQAELARHVHHDAQSVARWEKNRTPIQPASEIVIRLLAVEKLNLGERGSGGANCRQVRAGQNPYGHRHRRKRPAGIQARRLIRGGHNRPIP